LYRKLHGSMDQRQFKPSQGNTVTQCFPKWNTQQVLTSTLYSLHSPKISKYGCLMATNSSHHPRVSLPLATHRLPPWPPSHIPPNHGTESNSTLKSHIPPSAQRSSPISPSKYVNVAKTGRWRTLCNGRFNGFENSSEIMERWWERCPVELIVLLRRS